MFTEDKPSVFPEVEIIAFAADMQLKLHYVSNDWLLEVKYVGPGENCGLSRQTVLTAKQAACMMALFIASDGMEELEQSCYDVLSTVSFGPSDFSPIP